MPRPALLSSSFGLLSVQDLCQYLNSIPVSEPLLKQAYTPLSLQALSEVASSCYKELHLPKKNGSLRIIHGPNPHLKAVQKGLCTLLNEYQKELKSPSAYGFVPGRNIVDNAARHTGKNVVINLDLLNFFPTINSSMVAEALAKPPASIPLVSQLNQVMTNLMCREDRLPQGAPSSPAMANLVCHSLDLNLRALAQKHRFTYTRYADDLTFSSNYPKVAEEVFINIIYQRCEKLGFKVNKEKTRIQRSSGRQSVTGLVVNSKVSVKKKYCRITRAMLHNWKKLGYEEAEALFKANYPKGPLYNLSNVLLGRIEFIGMVDNHKLPLRQRKNQLLSDTRYMKLLAEYWELMNGQNYSFIQNQKIFQRLVRFNRLAENVAMIKNNQFSSRDRFIRYCTYTFVQLEELYKVYFLIKFQEDYSKIGRHFFDNNDAFKRMLLGKKKEDHSPEDVERARKEAENKTSFADYKTYMLESQFLNDCYYAKGRNPPKLPRLLRQLRNFYVHGSEFTKRDEASLKQTLEGIPAKNAAYKKKHQKDRVMPKDEVKAQEEYLVFKWIDGGDYDSVRAFLGDIVALVRYEFEDRN
ncbi:reverse transcriptase domain-containing protein [Neolewinella lacunae]|uniref:RNA-directed DNA polymerase n=1 Tax=Neolewinella lacunae TaxID=1517758 RepID=A0A923PHR9_9BACT|nr:reverse transcriptase domain-containing protein [Neolewinella lacunae]MBC6994307.1 RNA-directed DNA polymerase [Neolewinella lacunae]MDN3634936.1 reverse transcriptase domain-containing protein [Neolewinella lacunae]